MSYTDKLCYTTHIILNISKGNKVGFSQIYARKREVRNKSFNFRRKQAIY